MKYLLDMDGVIADFVGGVGRLYDTDLNHMDDWGIEEFLGVSEKEMWIRIDIEGPEFWATLPEYPWTNDLIRLLGPDNLVISTAPSRSADSLKGKAEWLQEMFGYKFNRYMFGRHKHLLAGSGLTLIDDKDANVEAFRAHGGRAVLFPQKWNKNEEFVSNRVGYVAQALGLRSTKLTLK